MTSRYSKDAQWSAQDPKCLVRLSALVNVLAPPSTHGMMLALMRLHVVVDPQHLHLNDILNSRWQY